MSVEVEALTDEITVDSKVEVEVSGSDTAVTTDKGVKDVEATSNTYVVSSGGMYAGNMRGSIPKWLDDAVTQAIADGTVSLSEALSDLDTYVRNMETGVNQSIASLQNANTAMNMLITTNKTQIGDNVAAIGEVRLTKITATDATAISQEVMAAEFNDPNSYITNSAWYVGNVKVFADATSANTSNLDAMTSIVTDPETGVTATADNLKTGYTTVGLNPDGTLNAGAGELGVLSARVGDLDVRLVTEAGVSAGYFHEWDGTEPLKIGMIHIDTSDGAVYQYYGGSYNDGFEQGWKRLDIAAVNIANGVADSLASVQDSLQKQIDGAITTWFGTGAPEFLEGDSKYVSTNTSADLLTDDLVWDVRSGSGQMYKYTAANSTGVDLTAISFPTDSNWLPVYKVIPEESQWYIDDNVDVSNGYVWYDANNNIQPVLDPNVATTDTIRSNHLGDLYYDKDTGFGYRFSHDDLPNDVPDRGVYYSWVIITDVNITKALADAARAQDTADGKRTVFTGTEPPGVTYTSGGSTVQVGTGDLWIPADGVALPYYSGEIYKATVNNSVVTWTIVANYKRTTDAIDAAFSSAVNVVYGSGAPTSVGTFGDYYLDTTSKEVYRYEDVDGSYKGTLNWVLKTGDTANGVVKVYDAQLAADLANSVASAAESKLSDIAADSKLTPSEKLRVIDTMHGIDSEYPSVANVAGTLDDPTTLLNAYTNAYSDLHTYIDALLSNVGSTSNIVRSEFTGVFTTYYNAKSAIYKQQVIDANVRLNDEIVSRNEAISNLQRQSDKRVNTIISATTPDTSGYTTDNTGDYWYDSTNKVVKKYTYGTNPEWSVTTDIGKDVFDFADGKRSIYGGATPPNTTEYPYLADNDIWIPRGSTNPNYVDKEVYYYNSSSGAWEVATKYTEDLTVYANEVVTPQLASLQRQVDKKVEYFFVYSGDADPADAWTTDALREAHQGDLKYVRDTGEAYRYDKIDGWYLAEDMVEMLSKTAKAQYTADGKRTVYYLDDVDRPINGVQVGDLNVNPTTKVLTSWDGTKWVDTTNTATEAVKGWAGGASKLITDPDTNVITGWSFADGSNIASSFTVNADVFQIQGSTSGYTPFAIDTTTGKIKFTGDVRFEGLGIDGSSTSIDGGKITTGTIDASKANIININASSIVADSLLRSPRIEGGIITGSIIKASYIDTTSSKYLTTYTAIADISTIDSQYYGNFAHDSNGNLLPDSNGYYRLVTSVPLYKDAKTYTFNNATANSTPTTYVSDVFKLDLYPYNAYKVYGNKLVNKQLTNSEKAYLAGREVVKLYSEVNSNWTNAYTTADIGVCGIPLKVQANVYVKGPSDVYMYVQYSLDGGDTWVTFSSGTRSVTVGGLVISITASTQAGYLNTSYSNSVTANVSIVSADGDMVTDTYGDPLFSVQITENMHNASDNVAARCESTVTMPSITTTVG